MYLAVSIVVLDGKVESSEHIVADVHPVVQNGAHGLRFIVRSLVVIIATGHEYGGNH